MAVRYLLLSRTRVYFVKRDWSFFCFSPDDHSFSQFFWKHVYRFQLTNLLRPVFCLSRALLPSPLARVLLSSVLLATNGVTVFPHLVEAQGRLVEVTHQTQSHQRGHHSESGDAPIETLEESSPHQTVTTPPDIHFNQHWLERKYNDHQILPPRFSSIPSVTAVGAKLPNFMSSTQEIDFHSPLQILRHVFKRIPEKAFIFPTETYYYWSFAHRDTELAGNLRFVDIHDGLLHIGYYDKQNPHNSLHGAATFDSSDGVQVKRLEEFVYRVSFEGATKLFYLNPTALEPPKRTRLLEVEEFVARIFDESGFQFFLLFNHEANAFYYILSDELPLPDQLKKGPEPYYLSPDSAFIFARDEEYRRYILAGVHEKHIYMNDYYDGPFDQVPPRLQLKEKILKAYPYAKERGGIDTHGNFKKMEHTRMAISPYTNYKTLKDFLAYQSRCQKERENKSQLWSCYAYEWKRDFHKTLARQRFHQEQVLAKNHKLFTSQGWPANHLADKSKSWPSKHQAESSSNWPKNHAGVKSSSEAFPQFH